MRLPKFEHLKPASLQDGLALLAGSGQEIMAGGTDLLGNMKFGVIKPRQVLSIRTLPELRRVGVDAAGDLHIGACATLADLARNPLVRNRYPALRDAINAVASVHIRNMATLGGNLCLAPRCWYYNQSQQWRNSLATCHRTGGEECHAIRNSPRCHAINSSDTVPALIVLDARVCLSSKRGERWLPLRDFYRDDGNRHTVLEAEEILTSIVIPKPSPGDRTVFIKVQQRKGLDFAVGSIGASLKGHGPGMDLTLVVNSVASSPRMLTKTTQIIREEGFAEATQARAAAQAAKELGTVSNLFTSAGYKRQIVEALVKRALSQLQPS